MKIFAAEIEDGLEDTIKANASVSYASAVEKGSDKALSASQKKEIKSIAGLNDSDLYYTQSILVTSNWNRNDDIFDPKEVWIAKDTPTHKPTNLEHDENYIVGHITANWPITEDGVLIDPQTPVDNLPQKFHILTASVIYQGFTEPELKERASKLIDQIELGEKYVSMECFFKGFDYGIEDLATGNFQILERKEETAYLTKHLRAYGGVGVLENKRIGRVLRNLTFSGKGFVDKPANPESIIFRSDDFKFENQKASEEKSANFKKEGVSIQQAQNNKEALVMSSENPNPQEKGEAMSDCSEMVKEAYASRDEFKVKASELETALETEQQTLAEVKAALEALTLEKEQAMKMADEEKKKKQEEMDKMKAELDAANEVLAAYKSKEEEMKKKEMMMKRKASLIDAGLDSDTAEAELNKFENLDDQSFDNMINLLAAMKPKKEDMPKKEEEAMMMKKKASEDLSEVLENVEASEDADLSVGSDSSEEDDSDSTTAALVEFVYSRLGKTLNK